jgi:hypothetical protein
MHPELLSYLVAEHRRDLAAATYGRRAPAARAAGRARRPARPRLRVCWTRTTLSAGTGRGRGRSWVIVISATRTF